MKKSVDYRCIPVAPEVRATGDKKRVEGYAALFYDADNPGTEYEIYDGAYERIAPSAFDETFKKDSEVLVTFNHDMNQLLGRRSAETLSVRIDKKGVFYSFIPPPTVDGEKVRALIERGDLKGSSIGFLLHDLERDVVEDREIITITKAELHELGPVTDPAYTATSANLRTRAKQMADRDAELAELATQIKDLTDSFNDLTEKVTPLVEKKEIEKKEPVVAESPPECPDCAEELAGDLPIDWAAVVSGGESE
jgi:hypothetical protein